MPPPPKKILSQLIKASGFESVLALCRSSGLKDDGWFEAFKKKESVDRCRKPIPWCTYPYIKFIEPRLKKRFVAFEYGCGNSTLWYAKRLSLIIAVEHDHAWYKLIKNKLPDNAEVRYRNLKADADYAKEILNTSKKYELIVIDGRDRINCVKNSIVCLKKDGIIIFDDSDRIRYKAAYGLLKTNGFKRLDFWGMGPVCLINWCTSIFYRTENCLDI